MNQPPIAVEVIKHDPAIFGGWQSTQMSPEEVSSRLCVAKGCGDSGFLQVLVWPPEDSDKPTLRIVCKRHLVKVVLAMGVVLGDPSPVGEAMDLLRRIGLASDAAWLREKPYAEPVMPEDFRCLACDGNGRLMPETQGMFSGRRWVHTCGETLRERAGHAE